jgi:Zn-dependent peptidase ImmA (M78 family)
MEQIPGFSSPPFDPRIVARTLGIPVHFTSDLRDIDALIVHRRGTFHILANSNVRNAQRLNFTLAHEIGHVFFAGAERKVHRRARDRQIYDRTPEGRILERMCDLAAAELLMPPAWFDQAVGELGFDAAAVPRLAQRFDVSLEAAALRLLATRDDEPWAIGFFEYGIRPSARQRTRKPGRDVVEVSKYRVRRLFRTRRFPFLFPEGKSVPSESVLYRSSLGTKMLEARECFSLRGSHAEVGVSAYPLHRKDAVEEPPLVCGVLRIERG